MYTPKLYINGEIIEGRGRLIQVVCPGTGKVIGEVKSASKEQAQQALEAARDAFSAWSALSLEERGKWMVRLGEAVTAEQPTIGEMMAYETGKFIGAGMWEATTIQGTNEFFLGQARANFDRTERDPRGQMNLSIREPLGVVLGYLAWNFPLFNLSTKIGPVMASGCTAVLKPATRTPLSTLYVGEIMHEIGFPKGVINFVVGSAKEIGPTLTSSRIPSLITIIGSSQAGRELIRDSSTSIKRFSLELGGNAPVIITSKADVGVAATATMRGKMSNCGQVCVSPQRLFVERSVYNQVVQIVVDIAKSARCGTVHDKGCNISPMISPEAVVRMEGLVADALAKGATLEVGGKRPVDKEKGNYFLPTVLTNVTPDMRVYREEVFGPILSVMAYDDLSDAIRMGNDTEHGLYSYAWTRDIAEANRIARGLRFGTVAINGAGPGIHLPHGGIKESGIGKDGSHYSLDEYSYIKSIRLNVG